MRLSMTLQLIIMMPMIMLLAIRTFKLAIFQMRRIPAFKLRILQRLRLLNFQHTTAIRISLLLISFRIFLVKMRLSKRLLSMPRPFISEELRLNLRPSSSSLISVLGRVIIDSCSRFPVRIIRVFRLYFFVFFEIFLQFFIRS